jgi:hypothetical protein
MEKQQQKLVGVTLAKAHEHAGVAYAAGETIQVTEPERDWLVEHQVISAPKAAKETK